MHEKQETEEVLSQLQSFIAANARNPTPNWCRDVRVLEAFMISVKAMLRYRACVVVFTQVFTTLRGIGFLIRYCVSGKIVAMIIGSQEGMVVIPVMLAHCLTNNVPIGKRTDYNDAILPLGEDWCYHLYAYVEVYVKMIRASLMKINHWETYVVGAGE